MTPGQLYVSISTLSAKEAVKLIQQAKEEWEKIPKELLMKSITLIKGWHNMGIPDNDLAEETWKIYYNNAPEMKEIREFLNAPEP